MPDFPVPMLGLRAIQLVILVEKKTLHCHLGGVTVTHMLWPQLWQSGERVESVFLSLLQACSVFRTKYFYLVDRWSRKISVIIFCLTISNSGPDLFWELSNYNYAQQSTPPFYNILFISLLLVGESLRQEDLHQEGEERKKTTARRNGILVYGLCSLEDLLQTGKVRGENHWLRLPGHLDQAVGFVFPDGRLDFIFFLLW